MRGCAAAIGLALMAAAALACQCAVADDAGAVTLPGDKGKFHLFLLAGQSNMAGRGTLTAANRVSHERVVVMTRDGVWRAAEEPIHWDKPRVCGSGLAASFARAYADAHPDVTVGLVPTAFGGTKIAEWLPGHTQYTNAVRYARLALRDGTLKGILWHQGESDALALKSVNAYLPKFTNAITCLRRELGAENLPFVSGELGPYLVARKPILFWREMNAEIAKGTAMLPLAAMAPADGLYDVKRDNLHFETPSLRAFGVRYWEAFRRIAEKAARKGDGR